MKITFLVISTAALALATPIIPTMVPDLPSISISTEDSFSNIMMPTIVKTFSPFATPTDDPLPAPTDEPVPTEPWWTGPWPYRCPESTEHPFGPICAAAAEFTKTWKEKLGM